MFYMRKIADYLKILTDEEVKNFAVITFGECFRYTRKKLYFKLSEKIFFRKVEESLLYFCQHLMKWKSMSNWLKKHKQTFEAKIMQK